ncbi:phosphatase PAP2 family protein [Ahrensia kielensis]|uniref:Phosphatase PAP2 family protein n=1 Tax=Ahrensia kielensis TaxID=76980 RepID=A0ABU9T7J2_9HYPH
MQTQSDNGFGFWSKPLFLIAMLFLWSAILVFFRTYPAIDMAVANFFYHEVACSANAATQPCFGFPVAMNSIMATIRNILHRAPVFIGVGLIILLIYSYHKGKRAVDSAFRNQSLVLANLIIGTLLVVNSGFKENFGRVRPRDIIDFGGKSDFTLAGDFIGQCVSNCSFPSGEAAAGGWLLCCGLLFAPRWRKPAYIALFILGAAMALLRVTFGAHFISDVLLGYITTLITCSILAIAFERIQKWRMSR